MVVLLTFQRRGFCVDRRTLLTLPLVTAAMPLSAALTAGAPPVGSVPAGSDREGRARQIGISATTYKVLTRETGGALFAIEQANARPGGPPLHIHHGEDELFYAIEGEYIVQVGDRKFPLKAGDCVLGPRGIPHAWAFTGHGAGRLLLTYTPAGRMEPFFNAWSELGFKPGGYSSESDAALLRRYGMERVGPPILATARTSG